MNKQDVKLNCSECGRKIGAATLFDGTMNVTSIQACCLACLPKRLNKLEKEGYDPEVIKSFRKWLSNKQLLKKGGKNGIQGSPGT